MAVMNSESPFDTFDSDIDGRGEATPFDSSSEQPKPSISSDNNNNALPDDDDAFDPFGIESTAQTTRKRSVRSSTKLASSSASVASKGSAALPPRLEVKFKIKEEVSSGPSWSNTAEGACDVYVSGVVLASQTSSDALKNVPFVLAGSSPSGAVVDFTPNETYTKTYATKGQQGHINVIKIPKNTVGYVTVGKYTISETISHMPLLLEKKITKTGNKVQMAFQVRSKLTNLDDLNEFSIAVAMDETVVGDSVAITSGNGDWDRGKRSIIWKLDTLPRGESFVVTARARVTPAGERLDNEDLKFPVMMRCKSQDQISTARFQALEASGYPATISHSMAAQSFKLIHRLN